MYLGSVATLDLHLATGFDSSDTASSDVLDLQKYFINPGKRPMKAVVVAMEYSSDSGMQALQKDAAATGVVWLTLISSAPGTQGYVTAAQANELTAKRQAAPAAVLFDPEGTIGKLYKATVTPHMYVIDTRGMLVYAGAIDDRPTTRQADIQGAQNYVRATLESVLAGQAVKTPLTRAYGCTIKYA